MKLGLLLVLPLLAAAAPADEPLRASIDGLPFGELPQQHLPASGCAAYLWSKGTTHALVAMASADPAQLRVSFGGAVTDLPRTAQRGAAGFGFDHTTTYQSGENTAILDMTIETQSDLTQGAAISAATLTLERQGKDTVVLPVGGLIGCAVAAPNTK